MIEVTRLNGTKITINAEHIETVDETPDTVITLVSGKKFIVTEKTEDVTNLVIEYKKKTHMINAVG
ncbi:MAG: flagellar FlbD family protein [Clostridium sp.]|nr:flagellar FlbD family protein [Clostridium sp.]MCM1170667.1 flagellar FlbD family protein [Clostridium sp.]MCM1209387.1 flagellar FlbD family protein [Ruminococcus sp.]MCM1287115.1 flagellar FlbD family protein [Clostridium sp.]